jgi:hypothetical protein
LINRTVPSIARIARVVDVLGTSGRDFIFQHTT